MRKSTKFIGALAVACLVAASGSAFTNTNTVAASDAGSGTTAIGSYATSDIQYDPNSTDPTKLDAVRFTLNKTARYVAIQTNASGSWFRSDDLRLSGGTVDSCTNVGNDWTCDVSGATPVETVVDADSLTVVATN